MFRAPRNQPNKLNIDQVRERLISCIEYYANKFQSGYPDIHMDPRLLREAVEISMLDIQAFKEYHGISCADRHKRAAFLMYWIARIKPIQIESNANFTPALGVVNETYAVLLGLNHLDIAPAALPEGYLKPLLFSLHRGLVDCASLAREMFLLEYAAKTQKKTL